MSDHRDRYFRACQLGAGPLNEAGWAALVEKAGAALEKDRAVIYGDATFKSPSISAARANLERHVMLGPTHLVVDAQTVLDVEFALAHATELQREILEIAADDLEEARRARLIRTINRAKAAVEKRLKRGQA